MKNSIVVFCAVACAAFLYSFSDQVSESYGSFHASSPLNTGGGPAGRSGAPGETSCTFCHGGVVQDGNLGANLLQIAGGGNEYTPEAMNSFTLTFSEGSTKNGFQIVALNSLDEMAGEFEITAPTQTQIVNNAVLSRSYVTHTANGTSLNSWSFDWFGPAVGGDVTFYVATNRTNSNSASSGDVIYTSSHQFTAPDFTGVSSEQLRKPELNVGFIPSSNELFLKFSVENFQPVSLNVIDLQGKSVYFKQMGGFVSGDYEEKMRLPELPSGLYSVTLFIGNTPMSGKVLL